MNSFYIYSIKNIAYGACVLSIFLFCISLMGYSIPVNIFYIVSTLSFLTLIFLINKLMKGIKQFDEVLEKNNFLVHDDSYQGNHYIDNLENIELKINKLISNKKESKEVHESLEIILKSLLIWRSGNLEERIPLSVANNKKLMIQFFNALNDLIDEVDAYIRESLGAMNGLSRRQFYRIIMKKGLLGSFLIGATKVNDGIVMFGKQNNDLMNKLNNDVKQMITSIIDETENITNSCKETVKFCDTTSTRSADATVEAKNTYSGLMSIEQLAGDLKKTSGTMIDVIRDANVLSEEGTQKIEKTKTIVMELKSRSAAIHGIVEMIREVAQKTNLLSINAAIEAAKAGKEGHGFRIVADEVRSLAHATMDSAEGIELQINAIQDAIGKTVSSVSHFTNTMVNINSVSGAIFDRMNEQNVVLDDITNRIRTFSGAIQNLITNVENVQKASSSAQISSQNINDVFKSLNENIFVLESSITKSISGLIDKS